MYMSYIKIKDNCMTGSESYRSRTTDTQWKHKWKQSEMFGLNVADKYASVVTTNLGLGWNFGCNLQAISLSLINREFFLPRLLQEALQFCILKNRTLVVMICSMDYGCPVRKSPSLHGRKSTPTPKFLGTAEAYFVCHIGPNFQISLIYAFIGCP